MLTLCIPCDSVARAVGADDLATALAREAGQRKLPLEIKRTSSRGLYWLEPLLELESAEGRLGFGPVAPEDVPSLLDALQGDASSHPLALGPVEELPYLKFEEGSPEHKYMLQRRIELGGFLPQRRRSAAPLAVPALEAFAALLAASGEGRELSTTMAIVRIMNTLLKDKQIGRHVVPASSVRNVPAAEIAMKIRLGLLGSNTIVCRHIPPAPGCQRCPCAPRSSGNSCHVCPPSVERNKAASSTPA